MPTPALALFGFLEPPVALAWLRYTCVDPTGDDDALTAIWGTARSKLGVPTDRAGQPDIQPLPPEGVAHVTTLTQQQWVAERLPGMPSVNGIDFCLVEIDPLIAYQLHIDLDRSNHHGNGFGQTAGLSEALNVCLPMQQPTEPLQVFQANGSMMITSRSLNLRTLWQGFAQSGFLGIHVGTALPFAHVVRFNGRYLLHNGFHRALALRRAGATHMPCIVREVATPNDAGIGQPGAFGLDLIESANPPTLAHFTSGRATEVLMKNFHRVVHISWAEYGAPLEG